MEKGYGKDEFVVRLKIDGDTAIAKLTKIADMAQTLSVLARETIKSLDHQLFEIVQSIEGVTHKVRKASNCCGLLKLF